MSALDGLVFTAVAIEASPGWAQQLHSVRRRVFGPGDACTTEALVGPEAGVVSNGTATLITEQGDTLIFQSSVSTFAEPVVVALTIFSPTVGELTVTAGSEWLRAVASLESLPHGHDH